MAGVLYVVATPIGNLEDITLRALRVLKQVDVIAAEDTRHTQKLLRHYQIRTPLTSYHEHNERTKAPALVERLLRGASIALVSDAGTPAISDPGYRLVLAAVAAEVQVTPLPGPSALTAVLSAAAFPTNRFVFEGFLPEKTEQRRERLRALHDEERTLVFYEAPHRLKDSLDDIGAILGDRTIVIAREVSKIHEQFMRGRISEIITGISDREARGEIVIVVHGSTGESGASEDLVKKDIVKLQASGMRVRDIADLLGEKYALPKKRIYRIALEVGKDFNR
ncbi:MAG TPA: 16S rRNA (cytidine(1402)-2'-O)-methyltransferase [Candidatus Binatia bacterium]|jgi:16S rRNA (cytidine1402-2'-O)-methyltransferase